DKSISSKFNRMSHGFVWSKFLQAVERRSLREGVPLIKVSPPYTSVIGILKYQSQYGISNHEAASYVIGRRAVGYSKENVPSHLFRFLSQTQLKTFSQHTNWKQWSLIQQSILKFLKQKGVKSLASWQHLKKDCLAELA
nr:transposase [Desulfitobacterium hafniense]